MAKLIVKLQSCELAHQISALAIDAMGELGILYHHSPRERDGGAWQWSYMFQLGLIIGGGTAQIQKNIIAERGLEMPREPNPADMRSEEHTSELQSLMRISYAVFCLKKKTKKHNQLTKTDT